MKFFKYIAVNQEGKKIEGEIEAIDKNAAAALLIESGLSVLSIVEKVDFTSILSFSIGSPVKSKDKVLFYRQFSTMVSAGIALDDALDIARTQCESKAFKEILNSIIKSIRAGASLGDSLAKYPKIFSNIELNLIKAGEISGDLDRILTRLADDLQNQEVLKGKVSGALMYPFFVIIVAVAVVGLIMVKLVPSMEALYLGFGATTLPLPTQILVNMSNFFAAYWIEIILAIAGLFIATKLYIKRPEGKKALDIAMMKFPIIGSLMQQFLVVSFIKTYSMLLSAGIPIITALDLTGKSLNNKLYEEALAGASKDLEKGVSLAVALSKHPFIPSILWRTIAIGEQTGKTDEIMTKVGGFYEQQVNDKVNNLTRLLEPLLLVTLGGAVGFIAVAIYLPIYSFANIAH